MPTSWWTSWWITSERSSNGRDIVNMITTLRMHFEQRVKVLTKEARETVLERGYVKVAMLK